VFVRPITLNIYVYMFCIQYPYFFTLKFYLDEGLGISLPPRPAQVFVWRILCLKISCVLEFQ
jgi:hypothetical protein